MLNKEKYIISCNKKGFVSLDDLQLMSYPISILITIYNENSKEVKNVKLLKCTRKSYLLIQKWNFDSSMKLFVCIFLYGSSSTAKLRLVRGMLQFSDCRISLQVMYLLLVIIIIIIIIIIFIHISIVYHSLWSFQIAFADWVCGDFTQDSQW